jgi:hypothetical protein
MVSHNSTLSTPRRRQGSEFVVIKELKPLRDSPRGRLAVRIIQGDRGRRLDIREHIDEDRYRGFTKRGVNLSSEEVDALFSQRDSILRLLAGGGA